MAELIHCKDCKWWQCKKILLGDGTYRDYLPGEYESGSILGGVSTSVGINIGSHCTRRNFDGDKWWCSKDDFCSFAKRRQAE